MAQQGSSSAVVQASAAAPQEATILASGAAPQEATVLAATVMAPQQLAQVAPHRTAAVEVAPQPRSASSIEVTAEAVLSQAEAQCALHECSLPLLTVRSLIQAKLQ